MHVILPTAQNTQVHKSSQNNLQSEILTMQTTKGLIYQLLLLILCSYCRCHGDYVNQFIAHVNGGEKEVAEVELHLQKRSANILSTVSTFIYLVSTYRILAKNYRLYRDRNSAKLFCML